MYTRHGHHIPGTVLTDKRPVQVARCGGPKICTDCSIDAAKILMAEPHPQGDPLADLPVVINYKGEVFNIGEVSLEVHDGYFVLTEMTMNGEHLATMFAIMQESNTVEEEKADG